MHIVYDTLDKWINTPTQDRAAIRWEGEEGAARGVTYRDVYREVSRVGRELGALGVGKGDVDGPSVLQGAGYAIVMWLKYCFMHLVPKV